MKSEIKLHRLKIIHTLIWVFFNVVFFYLLYAAIVNKIDYLVWIGIGLILLEVIVLLIFKMMCPLTLIARSYSNSPKENFDIYLPNWLAKNNKLIYSIFFIIILGVLIYQMLNRN